MLSLLYQVSHYHIYHQPHTHQFNGPFSRNTQVSRYQKGKTNLDFTGARDSEWQWHQLGHMQVCTSLQTDNHTNTSLLSFLQAGCPSCRPTNSVKALKAPSTNVKPNNKPTYIYITLKLYIKINFNYFNCTLKYILQYNQYAFQRIKLPHLIMTTITTPI